MAKIERGEKLSSGFKFRNKVTVDLMLTDKELEQLEGFRARTEKRLELPEGMEYTLDDIVLYIVGEVMSGRGKILDMDYAFKG